MDHWFVRAVPWISRFVQLVVWLCGGWVVVSAPLRGEPMGVVAFYGLAGYAVTVMASYYTLRFGEYVQGRALTAQLGHVFAQALEERLSVRETEMTTARAAQLWREIDPQMQSTSVENTRFRWIKNAIDNGHVEGVPLNANGEANRNTVVQVRDLAAFFRRKDWRMLVVRA